MNQKGNEFFSKVEKKYDVKLGRIERCPICRQQGQPMKGNALVMEHRLGDTKNIVFHRWSYSTGRIVEHEAQETNVL
jgi:hypothetical protein